MEDPLPLSLSPRLFWSRRWHPCLSLRWVSVVSVLDGGEKRGSPGLAPQRWWISDPWSPVTDPCLRHQLCPLPTPPLSLRVQPTVSRSSSARLGSRNGNSAGDGTRTTGGRTRHSSCASSFPVFPSRGVWLPRRANPVPNPPPVPWSRRDSMSGLPPGPLRRRRHGRTRPRGSLGVQGRTLEASRVVRGGAGAGVRASSAGGPPRVPDE